MNSIPNIPKKFRLFRSEQNSGMGSSMSRGSCSTGSSRSPTSSGSSMGTDSSDCDTSPFGSSEGGDYGSRRRSVQLEAYSISGLPPNTTEADLFKVLKRIVPVLYLHIDVHRDSREILTTGSVIIKKMFRKRLLYGPVYLENYPMHFELAPSVQTVIDVIKIKKKTVRHVRELLWPNDIRPGHPDYKKPAIFKKRPFNLSADRKCGHQFNDKIWLMILKNLKLRDLLRVESTCHRMRSMVHQLLGGNNTINLCDPSCRWYYHRQTVSVHYHTLLIQKLLLLNGDTLQHLHLGSLSFNVAFIVRAIKQCAPVLTHFTYGRLYNLQYVSFYAGEDPSYRYVAVDHNSQELAFKVYTSDRFVPRCCCTIYLNVSKPHWSARFEMKKEEVTDCHEALCN